MKNTMNNSTIYLSIITLLLTLMKQDSNTLSPIIPDSSTLLLKSIIKSQENSKSVFLPIDPVPKMSETSTMFSILDSPMIKKPALFN
jgi:hypothetical protein